MKTPHKNPSFQKKSGYNQERDSYVSPNGDLVYLETVSDGEKSIRRVVCRIRYEELEAMGLADLAEWIDEQDRRQNNADRWQQKIKSRYKQDLLTGSTHMKKQDPNGDARTDVRWIIAEATDDLFYALFPEEKPENVLREKVAGFLASLTENQRELIYARCILGMKFKDYRLAEIRRTGKPVTQQAIADRWRKIKERARKYFGMEKYK